MRLYHRLPRVRDWTMLNCVPDPPPPPPPHNLIPPGKAWDGWGFWHGSLYSPSDFEWTPGMLEAYRYQLIVLEELRKKVQPGAQLDLVLQPPAPKIPTARRGRRRRRKSARAQPLP